MSSSPTGTVAESDLRSLPQETEKVEDVTGNVSETDPVDELPEGGLRAWLVVLGGESFEA